MTRNADAMDDDQSELAGKPYRPSNGEEGLFFQDDHCAHCAFDSAFREDPDSSDGCQIIANALAFGIDHPDYPQEWVYDRKGRPCCTAFTTDPAKPLRCKETPDMFAPPVETR